MIQTCPFLLYKYLLLAQVKMLKATLSINIDLQDLFKAEHLIFKSGI